MAKRFIDTKLFDDSWFLELSNEAKIFFIYFITKCDHAGILDLSKSKLKFETKINSIETVLKQFKNRLIKLRDNYYFMPAFVKFQYRELSEKSPAQRSVINRLKEFNLINKNNTVIKQLGKSLQTLQDKEKDKDMDIDKDIDKAKEDKDIITLTPHQKVINCYLEIKNKMPFSCLPKETIKSGYRRFGRAAKALLIDTNNNVDLICKAIRYLPIWADAKNLSWSLETVSKALAEPKSFIVNFPKLSENERKLIKTYLYMKGWNEEKVKSLDLQKSKHTLNLIPIAKEILGIFNNDLNKVLSALEKYKSTLKEGELNLYFASKWIFENYGG